MVGRHLTVLHGGSAVAWHKEGSRTSPFLVVTVPVRSLPTATPVLSALARTPAVEGNEEVLLPPRYEGSQDAAGRRGCGPQHTPPQQVQDCRDCPEQWSKEGLNASDGGPQLKVGTDLQQLPRSTTQWPRGLLYQLTQAGLNPGLHPTIAAGAQGRMQSQILHYQQGVPATQLQQGKSHAI